jgi:anti-sigma B factor antagonist
VELRVETEHVGDHVVVRPVGVVDFGTVTVLRTALQAVFLHGSAHVVLDLDQTTFIDSTGLGALVSVRRRAHAFRGSLKIVCHQPQVLRVFQVTRLDRVFEFVEWDDLSWPAQLEA